MPSKRSQGSFAMDWASCTRASPAATPTRPSPTSTSASTPTSSCAARAASESWRAAKTLSRATVTRVRRATSISRSSLARPMMGKATSRPAGPAPSMTSASETLATVSPTAPDSSWGFARRMDLCVLVCGRSLSPCCLAYPATRWRFRSRMSRSTTSAGVSISRTNILPLPGHLEFQFDVHFVAHQDAAGFQRHVKNQPEIPAVQLGGGRRANLDVAPRVFHFRGGAFDVEIHFPGNTVNGQIADDSPFALSHRRHFFRNEGDLGKLLHVEEIRALKMLVPLAIARLNGGGVDGRLDFGIRRMLRIEYHRAGHSGKLAAHIRHHQVANLKPRRRVAGVDYIGNSLAHSYFFLFNNCTMRSAGGVAPNAGLRRRWGCPKWNTGGKTAGAT